MPAFELTALHAAAVLQLASQRLIEPAAGCYVIYL
jgi:hypothetical protein